MNFSDKFGELGELLGALGIAAGLLLVFAILLERSWRERGPDSSTTDHSVAEQSDEQFSGHPSVAETLHAGQVKTGDNAVRSFPAPMGKPTIERLYISAEAGAALQRVTAVQAVARRGLKGDRYYLGRGFWTDKDECNVTIIAQEDLDEIMRTTGIAVQNGEHRRNLVTRNIRLETLVDKRFRIGDAYFAFDRFRPPCLYLQKLTEPGMVAALVNRSGICVRCFRSGIVRENDLLEIIHLSVWTAITRWLRRLVSAR